MIINLPVQIQTKCISIPFHINITPEILSISTTDVNTNIYNIILCSDLYGIINLPVVFPLVFNIIHNTNNNMIVCDLFYIFQIISSDNTIDFIHIMLNNINTANTISKYILYKNTNLQNLIGVLKLYTNNDITNNTLDMMIHKIYYRISKYLNFCLEIIASGINNIAQASKILRVINVIKQYKMNFYGTILTIEEHIEHINNRTLLKKKRQYFYEKDNKLIRVSNIINRTNIKSYPTKYNEYITVSNLLNILIVSHYKDIFNLCCHTLYKQNINIYNMVSYYISNNSKDYMIYLETDTEKYNILLINELSFTAFKQNIKTDFDEVFFNKLLDTYSYPISYDKRTLNLQFAKILYYSIKFQVNNINNRIKSIILFLIKFQSQNNISSSKIYTDSILYQIIKILIFNDTYMLLDVSNNARELLSAKFIENSIVISLAHSLTWKSLVKNTSGAFYALKYIINRTELCKELIIDNATLSKHNMDIKLKKIILEPLLMLNYLKTEDDFHKWIVSYDLINKIYYNIISLNSNDIIILCKILYIYSKIKNQINTDKYYNKLLNYIKEHNHLVLFNERINIRFKDIFKNININLGYMARDINNMEANMSISISDEDTSELIKLKKKYYKYKGKYLEMKTIENKDIHLSVDTSSLCL